MGQIGQSSDGVGAVYASGRPLRYEIAHAWRAELLPCGAYETAFTPDDPIVGFAFDNQSGLHAFASDRRTPFRARPNGLACVPAGCDVYSQSERGGEYLKITLLRAPADDGPDLRQFSDAIDRTAIGAASRLRRQLLMPGTVDPLTCEAHVAVLIDRAAWFMGAAFKEPSAHKWMTPQRLRRVDDLIEARLDGKLTVQDLADALGLSAGFFSRAFRAAVGKAPHDHIIDRRVSRARLAMRDPDLDLSAIAHATGFSSHAHMTATFRARLGVTPRELRRKLM